MFDWFKKSSDKPERRHRREQVGEPLPFRPAKLPPRRPDSPSTTHTGTTPVADASSPIQFRHDEFTFQPGGDWVRVPSSDAEQFAFRCDKLQTLVTISFVRAAIPKARLVEAARRFTTIREEAERSVDDRAVTLGDRRVELAPSGDVVDIAYAGYDDRGRIFRFMGFVTEAKMLSFYCETMTTDNDLSKRIFDEAFRGLKFYVP